MITVPFAFARKAASLNWHDWKWAFENNITSEEEIIELACDLANSGDYDASLFDLAGLLPDDQFDISAQLNKMVERVPIEVSSQSKEKWLYIVLAWVFDQRHEYDNPLVAVEQIYADFDYPERMKPFVRYMPPEDGYDPTAHSYDDNIRRLMSNWRNFLVENEHRS